MFLLGGWESAQKQRSQDSGIEELMDNDIRLYMMGMALEAIQSDAAIGGGSRSFSWDSYQLWDEKSYGFGGAKPEMVHNELLQAATDYGLIGAFLILGLLGGALLTVFIKTTFEQRSALADSRHFWRLGGIAALAGMFVQSNFSFVFHLLPGVSLLGICLASCYWVPLKPRSATSLVTGILLIGSCVFCLFTSLPLAWKGTLALRALWTSHYGKTGSKSLHSKVSSLDEAIHLWPRYEFYLDRAMLHQQLAGAPDNPEFEDYAKFAMSDYQKAFQRHPYSPEIPINQANLLSSMGLSDEADVAYQKAISLQGQMEPAFRAHYYNAEHSLRRSLQLYREGDAANALLAIEDSAEHIETANRRTPAWVIDIKGRNLRISIHERLGTMREANGNRDGAITAYNYAASIPGGNRAHYRSAVLIGRMGRDAWAKRRPSEALYRFIEARRHLGLAARELPEGVTLTSSLELSEYLDKAITLLKAAKVEPQK
jgi:tetratricopeptide (TPR) repeat protein